jgi:WD40 repeat protein
LRLAFLPDSQHIVTVDTNSKLRFWDIRSSEEQGITLLKRPAIGLTASPDCSMVITLHDSFSEPVDFFNSKGAALPNPLQQRAHNPRFLKYNAIDLTAIAWSPDGRQIAVGYDRDSVTIYEAQSWQILHKLGQRLGQRHAVTSLAYSSDSAILAVGNQKGVIEIWDAHTAEVIKTIEMFRWPVTSLNWSIKGDLLLATTGGEPGGLRPGDKTSRIDVESAVEVAGWEKASATVCHSPDGSQYLIGGRAGKYSPAKPFELFNAKTNQLVGHLEGSEGASIAAFSPNGLVIGAANESAILFWDAKTRNPLRTAKDFDDLCPRPHGNAGGFGEPGSRKKNTHF